MPVFAPDVNPLACTKNAEDPLFVAAQQTLWRQFLPAAHVICGLHAYEGTTMAYDWTGDATRKRNRQKLGYAILLSAVIILGVPAAIGPFL